jgi:hypothetical protein
VLITFFWLDTCVSCQHLSLTFGQGDASMFTPPCFPSMPVEWIWR